MNLFDYDKKKIIDLEKNKHRQETEKQMPQNSCILIVKIPIFIHDIDLYIFEHMTHTLHFKFYNI